MFTAQARQLEKNLVFAIQMRGKDGLWSSGEYYKINNITIHGEDEEEMQERADLVGGLLVERTYEAIGLPELMDPFAD